MSCLGKGGSSSSESKAIEKELRAYRKQAGKQHKILLLGTGNSGKSTFCKQLTAKYGGENPHFQLTDAEIIRSLRENLLDGTNKVLAAVDKKIGGAWPSNLKDKIEGIRQATADAFSTKIASDIQEIMQEDEVKEVLEAEGDYLCLLGGVDGLCYYTQNAKNYADPKYKPTPDDRLRNRIKTVGIVESKFSYAGYEFHICDVAGQRSERKKWIHCFNNVSAIIYLLSCNEYDVHLEESGTSNSLFDAVRQFQVVSELQIFENTPFIVFFNKYDLLPEKVKRSPLGNTFKDYNDWCSANPTLCKKDDADTAISYFTDIMRRHFKGNSSEFFTTCALDAESCIKVFESVQRSVMMRNIHATGLELG